MNEKCPMCGYEYPGKTSKESDPNYMYHKCGKCGHEWRDEASYLPNSALNIYRN